MTPAPRTALAIKFSLAVTVALAVLVPTTMSYGMPLWPTPIDNLSFSAGRLIDSSTDPAFVTTLDSDDLWKKSATTKLDGYVEYVSVTGNCTARLHDRHLPDSVLRVNGDQGTTENYINYLFPDAAKGSLKNIPVDRSLNYRAVDSGKTVEGLTVRNDVATMVFRAFTASNTVLIADVTCTDVSEEATALTADAFLHTAIVAP